LRIKAAGIPVPMPYDLPWYMMWRRPNTRLTAWSRHSL